MAVSNYRELVAWQTAMELTERVYRLTSKFPRHEKFGLSDQLRRASVSVPSNIAEGQGRRLRKQFALFLRIARGSVQEIETQLLIAARLGYAPEAEVAELVQFSEEVGRIVSGLLRSIELG